MLIIAILAIASQGKAQVYSDSLKTGKNIIKTDIAGLLLSTNYHLNASWEHLLSKKSSFEVGFYFYKPSDRIIFSQFNLSTDILYRRYFNKQNYQMKGFYLAPFMEFKWTHRHGYYDYEYDVYDRNPYRKIDYTFLNTGLQAGYQWIYKKKWTIDLYARAGINLYNNKPKPQNYYHSSKSVDILWNAGLKIGYKF